MPVRFLALLALLLVAGPALLAQEGSKMAIVIGVQEHDDKKIQNLKYCQADVEAIRTALTDPDTCGFKKGDVVVLHTGLAGRLHQPTKNRILGAVATQLGRARPGDTVVLFFSGHGVIRAGQAYLVPRDCNVKDIPGTAVPIADLVEMFSECQARHRMLILDCCHAGAEGRNLVVEPVPGGLTQPGGTRLAEPFKKLKNQVVTLASCQEDEKSYEWTAKKRGYFTHFLVESLQSGFADVDGDGVITSTELAAYLEGTVRDQVKHDLGKSQTPSLVVIRGAVPSIPLARASFKPYTLPLTGQQNGLPPEGCKGQLIVHGRQVIPDVTGVPPQGRGLRPGNYFLELPKLGVRKDFVLTMGFDIAPNDDNAAGLSLFPAGRKPWHLAVFSRGGIVVNGRKVVPRGGYLNAGQNSFILTRRTTERGTTITVEVNGVLLASDRFDSGPVPKIKLGLYHGGRRGNLPAVTSFEVRPLKPGR
jgi:hypothetical protein